MKKILVILVALIGFGLSANAQNKTVKTILFEGGSCEFYELVKNSMLAPADMQEGEKAFMLRLKCSLKQGAGNDKIKVLYTEGKFVAPDGTSYKAGSAASLVSDGLIYSLIVAIPESVAPETLKFVYNKQVMLLKK